MNNIILLLGANLGKINQNFEIVTLLINQNIGKILKTSSLYQSEPWGFETPELFINQVIEVQSDLSAFEILKETQAIEKQIGRKTKSVNQEYSSRLMDVDILFFNNDIIESETLTIPHPRLHLRNFTLLPLTEVIPNYNHPKLNKSISQLLECSKDTNTCIKI